MSRFSDEPLLKGLPGGKMFVLHEPFSYEVGFKGSNNFIKCPIGFMTDFASIPRICHPIIPKLGKHNKASVLHDWLYWEQKKYNRKRSDDIFLEAMKVSKVSRIKRNAIYFAVRAFGWMAWKNNAKDKSRGGIRILDVI